MAMRSSHSNATRGKGKIHNLYSWACIRWQSSSCSNCPLILDTHFFETILRDAWPNDYRWIFGKVPNGLCPPPPPPALFWEKCCDFFQNHDGQHWICNEIFWIGNDPPLISKFFRKFMTKSAVSNAKKIATKFFGSEMTPPPLWNFSKNSSIMDRTGFPNSRQVRRIRPNSNFLSY